MISEMSVNIITHISKDVPGLTWKMWNLKVKGERVEYF